MKYEMIIVQNLEYKHKWSWCVWENKSIFRWAYGVYRTNFDTSHKDKSFTLRTVFSNCSRVQSEHKTVYSVNVI